ncbi:MAG: hypothetical protein J5958_06360 [Clostridia bacterium]|nr:hypothetical protein [Clostridia bacterium]
MKTAGKLLALLIAAALLATFCGCSLFRTNRTQNGTAAPAGTEARANPATADDLTGLASLYGNLFRTLTKAQTAVAYNDPAVGTTLNAYATLQKGGDNLTYRATVDRLNDAESDRFLTSETLPAVSGTVEEIRANYQGLFVWDRVATGLILATPVFTGENLSSPAIRRADGNKTLTASVPDEKLDAFFGMTVTDVSGMEIAVSYTDSAVLSLTLTYTAGAAAVTVTVTFTY